MNSKNPFSDLIKSPSVEHLKFTSAYGDALNRGILDGLQDGLQRGETMQMPYVLRMCCTPYYYMGKAVKREGRKRAAITTLKEKARIYTSSGRAAQAANALWHRTGETFEPEFYEE